MDFFINFLSAVQKIFSPAKYLLISHDEKRIFDTALPIALTFTSSLAIYFAGNSVVVFGLNGLLYTSTELLKILIGFFIAALAAVATFPNPDMDKTMDGTPPRLGGSDLTRRRFLAYLFGYLSFISFFTYLFGSLANSIAYEVSRNIHSGLVTPIKYLFLTSYLLVFFNIACTTLLGLFYLTERIHQSKPALIKKSDKARDQLHNDN